MHVIQNCPDSCKPIEADKAYLRYSALMIASRRDPSLNDEQWYREKREAAYAAFFHAFSEML